VTAAIRVTQLTESTSRRAGGLFEAVRGLSRALQDASLAEISVIAGLDDLTEADRGVWGDLELVHVDTRHWRDVITGRGIAEACLQRPVDLMHVHILWTCAERAVVHLFRRGVRIPYIVSPHGTLSPWALNFKRWKKRISWQIWERILFANAACVHALNEAEADAIRAAGIRTPICIIPNGVDLPEFFEEKRTGKDRRILLFLGRLHPIKGVPELISAWGSVKPALRARWQLVIAGWDDGGHEANYRKLAAEVAPNDDIVFPGAAFGEKKRRLLCDADAFILPSHSEALPIAVLEAWGYGLPVVMTDACNLPEGFRCGAGFRLEPSREGFASRLAEFLSQSDLTLNTMGAAGRRLVEQRFTWNVVAAEMASVYRWMLGGERPTCVVMP
jgi:poly(glycerol-phosphate) alpha-glucosyltransferase